MKVKFGAIVVDGRGKLGGHVASKNRGGSYFRTKVTPTNPQTAAQSTVRNRLTTFSQAWRALTEVQRAAWNGAVSNFAKTDIFGDIKQPTGLNLYVKLNSNLDQVGVSPLVLPPLPSEVPPVITVGLTASLTPDVIEVDFTPATVPADTAFIVECTAQLSPGKSFLKNEFRFITFADDGTTSTLDILSEYTARFGTQVVGQKIGVRIHSVNKLTGQAGQPITATTIVLA